jgi:hypothetical protein
MNCPCIDNYYGVNSNNMYILGESKNNKWLGESCNNKFTQNVIGNYFFTNYKNNIFEIQVLGNMFMGNCTNNSFKEPFHAHTTPLVLGRGFNYNTVGTDFSGNISTMPLISNNSIGSNFKNNTLNGYVSTHTNNSITTQNTLYLYPEYNITSCTLGNNIVSNTIEGLYNTTITSNFFYNYVNRFTNCNINHGVKYCTFKKSCSDIYLLGSNNNI